MTEISPDADQAINLSVEPKVVWYHELQCWLQGRRLGGLINADMDMQAGGTGLEDDAHMVWWLDWEPRDRLGEPVIARPLRQARTRDP